MPTGAFIVIGVVFVFAMLIFILYISDGAISLADIGTGFFVGLLVSILVSVILLCWSIFARNIAYQEKAQCLEVTPLAAFDDGYMPAYLFMYKGINGTEYGYMVEGENGTSEYTTMPAEHVKISYYITKDSPALEKWEMRYENKVLNWLFGTYTRYYFNIPVNSVAIGPGF